MIRTLGDGDRYASGAVVESIHGLFEVAVLTGGRSNNTLVVNDSDNVVYVAEWAADAQKELSKIPFFVRGKARRNTERFAAERGVATITVETLYDANAHFSR